jgi:hypothetical protein
MTRHKDWEQRLNRCIAEARTRTFAWGEFDCAKWVCEVIEALTEKDCYAEFRGSYRSIYSAVRVVKRYGSIAELAAAVARQFGLAEIPLNQAGRGDVVLVHEDKYDSLAIVEGLHALGASDKGVAHVRRKFWKKAWKVD